MPVDPTPQPAPSCSHCGKPLSEFAGCDQCAEPQPPERCPDCGSLMYVGTGEKSGTSLCVSCRKVVGEPAKPAPPQPVACVCGEKPTDDTDDLTGGRFLECTSLSCPTHLTVAAGSSAAAVLAWDAAVAALSAKSPAGEGRER